MRTVYAYDRQNIADVATMYYGSAASVIDLCNDNGWDLDHDLKAGDPILLQDTYPSSADGDVADYLQSNGTIVVSDFNQDTTSALGTNDSQFIITNDDNYIGA